MPQYRKTWWLPRPVRAPISHDVAVKVFADIAQGKKWEGNRELHLKYEKGLSDAGIKRGTISRDGSGGRTWASLLRALGFWYPNSHGKVILTPVAEALIKKNRIKKHIVKQILNYQLPNAYFISKSFKFSRLSPEFKIFPFRFILKLLLDPQVEYLTLDEIALFVITARTNSDLPRIKSDILKYRDRYRQDGKELKERVELIEHIKKLYDHRSRKNAHLDYRGYLDWVRAIAHTFMINLSYIDGIERNKAKILIDPGKKKIIEKLLDFHEKMYPFSQLYKISEEAFAGHYGLELGKFKYTKKVSAPPVASLRKKASVKIALAVNELLSMNPVLETGEKIIEMLQEKTGLDRDLIEFILEKEYPNLLIPQLPTISQQFLETYLEIARDGKRWKEFEEMTRKIFKELGYEVIPNLHTKECEKIDALLLDKINKHSGIIEAKSGELYSLTPKDRDLMTTTYIPNFRSYQTVEASYNLSFFIYIVGAEFKGTKNLKIISSKTGISGSVINARQLLFLLNSHRKKKLSLSVFEKLFTLNKLLTDKDILAHINP